MLLLNQRLRAMSIVVSRGAESSPRTLSKCGEHLTEGFSFLSKQLLRSVFQ